MIKTTLAAVIGLGLAGGAFAGEPVQLTVVSELDGVTAGLFSGLALSFTGPVGTLGASSILQAQAQGQTISQTTLTPPSFSTSFQALAISQVRTAASGVGPTAAFGSGGVSLTIVPNS